MLCLFDIDGTLVDTGGAGMAALRETAVEIFGDPGPELDLAGATDLGIIEGVLEYFAQPRTEGIIASYLETYHRRLLHNLEKGDFGGKVLAGAEHLLDALTKRPELGIGLLTGNTARGAEIKIRHYGLDRYFTFGAYGCDAADRNLLGPVALERASRATGRAFSGSETWVIGDTPKDIACAKAMGARSMAVTTGRFSKEELQVAGADVVIESLDQAAHWF